MKNRTSLLSLAALLLALTASLVNAETVQQTTLGIKAENKSLFSVVDLSAEWTTRSDLNQATSPHSYDHSIELSASKTFAEKYNAFLSGSVQFTTLNSTVTRASSTEDYYTPGDFTFGVMVPYRLNDENKLSLVGAEAILSSLDSRYMGYLSATTVQGILSTHLYKNWLSLQNSLGATYIQNRYRFAPASSGSTRRGDINADAVFDYTIGPMITLFRGFTVGARLAVRGTHYLDQSNIYGFGNSYSATYSWKNISVWVKYLNKGYADRGETNLWFADQYKRLAVAGLIVNF